MTKRPLLRLKALPAAMKLALFLGQLNFTLMRDLWVDVQVTSDGSIEQPIASATAEVISIGVRFKLSGNPLISREFSVSAIVSAAEEDALFS